MIDQETGVASSRFEFEAADLVNVIEDAMSGSAHAIEAVEHAFVAARARASLGDQDQMAGLACCDAPPTAISAPVSALIAA